MNKSVKVISSKEAKQVYNYLVKESQYSKNERAILKALRHKIEIIKNNPTYGDPISKNKIPKEYKLNYNVKNLFRLELPNYWRMLYSLIEGESKIEIIAFVLDIIDHKRYNKKFGYRKN